MEQVTVIDFKPNLHSQALPVKKYLCDCTKTFLTLSRAQRLERLAAALGFWGFAMAACSRASSSCSFSNCPRSSASPGSALDVPPVGWAGGGGAPKGSNIARFHAAAP